ncbi:MAG: SDR family oxidoreductase [Nitrospirota bacterium]|nr:SDR family oxidoreductase [Nitrospirota bacterium]
MKPIALITGAAGLIGGCLIRSAWRWAPQWEVRGLTRAEVDLTDGSRVQDLWRLCHPSLVIHCAALSRTGACERDPAQARRINVEATKRLADLAHAIPFVFLSSDQVFDGLKGNYVETDEIHPLNVYGQTKAEAEQIVLQNPAHSVIRVALTAGTSATHDRSFVEDMLRAVAQGTMLTLFTDEFRCPIPAGALVRALWEFVECKQPGLYHLGGSDRLSRWEIGELLAGWYPELRPSIQPGSVADYHGPSRPPDLSMRSDKLQALLAFRLPGLRQWLASGPRIGDDPWDHPHG